MSLVANTPNHKLDLILEKLDAVLENNMSSKRGPKPKNRLVTYTRDETKYDSIHIFPFEKTDSTVKVALIIKNEDAASIVEVDMDKFVELAETVRDSKSKKILQIFDYHTSDDVAIFADGEWVC